MIELKNLTYECNGRKIVDSANYNFRPGMYVIQGENGIGKTTLLNIIAGYLKPDKGEAIIDDKLKIGYLFQEIMLFQTLTVRENFIIKANAKESEQRISGEEIDKIACEFNLKDKLDKKVSLLSGGEKQRVQMGVLSMEHNDVILMDEPIANLDEANSKEIISRIKDMDAELIIIISHQYIEADDNYITLEMKGGKLFEV